MTNIEFISNLIKHRGIIKTQKEVIRLCTEGYAHWEEIEDWAYHFNWLTDEIPEDIEKFITGGEKNVQLPKNNE